MQRQFIIACLLLTSVTGFSQNLERYNWYFGSSNQAIRFNRTSTAPTVVTKSVPFGAGGSATASDPNNANLLFYTDGQFVYDATHLQMPGGSGLTGNTASNQPVAICPVPGQTNKYFIFSNSAAFPAGGTITARVVDMGQFGNAIFPSPPLGDLEAAVLPLGLLNRAEGMTIVPDPTGATFWLLTQQINSTTFTATKIDAGSYTGTFVHTNTVATTIPTSAANLAWHAGKKKVAVSPQDTNTDAIILDFDNATGFFTFDRFIFNSGLATATPQSIYDIEWSLTGDYLYLSRFGEPGVNADLLQYDYVNPTTSLTSVLPAAVFRSFGVQMAPDSNLYHLYQSVSGGPIQIGRITKADTIASQVGYQAGQLSLLDWGGRQFPAFSPRGAVTLTVDFTFAGTCQGSNTIFFPNVTPGADSLHWDFGDGTLSNAWSPIHKFGSPSIFTVNLKAYYQGDSMSVSKGVSITAFPLTLNLVQDTTACRSEFPPPRGTSSPVAFSVTVKVQGGTPTSYVWSNGDLGPTLTPDSAGYYYVVVTDGSGCSGYAGVNVKEYGLQDQRSNVWYFGNKAGIDFNTMPNPPVPLSNSAMDAPEGCAIICDRNGKPLFYTDGNSVYNKNDVLIASGIGGDPLATQSSLVIPVPGDETLYYIITVEAINGTSGNLVRYSLFDIKQNGGLGAIVQSGLPLFAKSTERITASGKWLIIHEYGNNTFRAYPITAQGIGDPVLTSIGSDHNYSPQANGEGYMKLGPKNTLAVALSTPGTSNLVEIFHLNDTTGILTAYHKIDLKQPAGQVYGIEFSPGGNKLFATVKGTPSPSEVYEYMLDSLGHPYFKQKLSNPSEIGAIQLGPDGQIYMAINGSSVLGLIQPTDDTTRLSTINFSGFNLAAGTNSRLGLPNFIQQINNAFGGPSIDVSGFCLGLPTKFIGTPTDAIDQFLWFFGDGGSDTQGTTTHTYASAGNYNVSLRLTNRCGLDTTMVKKITIFPPPGRPTIPGAAALCNGPVTLDANTGNLPGLTYLWSDGQTTKTVVISDQAIISVTITDVNGCTSNGSSLVADNRPQVDLGPDQTLCQNAFTTALDAQNPGATYAWTVNGAGLTTAQTRALDTTTPGQFTYQVVVTDPITTCAVTDLAIFTIKASPSFTLTGTDPTTCLGTDGTITLQLATTAPPTGPYSYFVTGPGGFNQQAIDQTAPQTVLFNTPPMVAGIYSAIVNDQISGCTISQSFGLTDAPPGSASAAPVTFCDPSTIQITTSMTFPVQYSFTDNATGVVTGPTAAPGPSPFNMAPALPAGTYTIQLTDAGGCTFTINNFAVTPNPPIAVTITPSLCSTPPTLTASGPATNYSWSGPPGSIVGATTGPTIQLAGNGSITYTVVASAAGNCDNTMQQTVFLDNPTPSFTQTDQCQDNITLTASPSGPYTYRWYKSPAPGVAQIGQSIFLGLSENNESYQVELVNTINGCTYTSPFTTVKVLGTFDAGIKADPACDDNKPFVLTALTSATGVLYTWYRNSTVISGETAATTSQTAAGLYKVEISKGTCIASDQILVTKAPLPVGSLPIRAVICNDPQNADPTTSQVELDPGQFSAYNWFINELPVGYTNRVYTATSKGIHKVELTNSYGCVAADQTEVVNECIPLVEAPNAFRPTSSVPDNREFRVFGRFITDDFQIFIYNRWGELVFEYQGKDDDFYWNGNYKSELGTPLPGGTYSYIIKYYSSFHPERGVQEKRGGVVLLR